MYMSEEFKAEQENAEEKPEKVGFFKRYQGLTLFFQASQA